MYHLLYGSVKIIRTEPDTAVTETNEKAVGLWQSCRSQYPNIVEIYERHSQLPFIKWLIAGSSRVTLVVTFGFLSQNFDRWQGPMNGSLSFYEFRLSGGDTQQVVRTHRPYPL